MYSTFFRSLPRPIGSIRSARINRPIARTHATPTSHTITHTVNGVLLNQSYAALAHSSAAAAAISSIHSTHCRLRPCPAPLTVLTSNSTPIRYYSRTVTPQSYERNTNDSGAPYQFADEKKANKSKSLLRRVMEASLLTLVGLTAYEIWLMRNEETYSWQLLMWKTLPLRFMSHVWGSIHRIDLPVFLRRPLYMAWTRAFDCQLHEIADGGATNLEAFPNLNAFFIRRIDIGKYRPLAPDDMISPVDGRVNVFGEISPQGTVEQIKGMEYRVDDLLGFKPPQMKPDSKLYYYVLYLAPGDYHRMHSPADCTIAERRHFPGALYPVLPSIAQYIPSLFVRNERVVLSGAWKYGFFSMVPVGAYNVGSMKLTFDEGLDTNLREHTFVQYRPNLDDGLKSRPFFKSYRTFGGDATKDASQEVAAASRSFAETDPASSAQSQQLTSNKATTSTGQHELGQVTAKVDRDGVHLKKGDEFSRFELGSTIVVFFELDKGQTFNWNIEMNQKVKLGQRLGVILPPKKN